MAASITLASVADITDPKLKAFAASIADTIGLAAEKVVANALDPKKFPLPADPSSYERILRARYVSRPKQVQDDAMTKVKAGLMAAPTARAKSLGPLAKVNLMAATPVEQQVAALNGHLKLDLAALSAAATSAPAAVTSANRELRLRIRRVVCVDETGSGIFGNVGNDEISLGGTSIDETGDTKTIAHFRVGDNFDSGESKNYSPPRRLTFFNVLEGGSKYPKSYFVTLALAEVDMGGLADFLEQMTAKVKAAVQKKIAEAGTNHGPIGVIVALVLAYVVGRIFDAIGRAWHDDVFTPQTVRTTLSSPTVRFAGGSLVSPEQHVTFKGHGGEYRIDYDWEIAR